jgi:hypothetical protein
MKTFSSKGERLLEGDSVFHAESKRFGFIQELLDNGNVLVEWDNGETIEESPCNLV